MSTIGKRCIFGGPAGTTPLYVEGLRNGAGAIYPGTIVSEISAGLTRRADSGLTKTRFLVAEVNFLLQKTADDAWGADNLVAVAPAQNQEVNARVATGSALSIGTPLTADDAGQLKIATLNTEQILAYSAETVTTTTAAPGQLVRVVAA